MNIATEKEEYILLNELGLLLNPGIAKKFSLIKRPKPKKKLIQDQLNKTLTDEEIVSKLSSCYCLVFEITEECNFRCKYCVYSGKYDGERIHSKKRLTLNIAKEAINIFFDTIRSSHRKRKNKSIFIGFYGGECLLEFKLIQEIIEYIEALCEERGLNKIFEIYYRVTSNGYIIDDMIVSYFKTKGVMLDISLDGPETEHNKFRITKENKNSWKTIIRNIRMIKERFPAYYSNCVNFITTLHPLHNHQAVDKFFAEHQGCFKNKVQINNVNLDNLSKEKLKEIYSAKVNQSEMQFAQICNDIEPKFSYKKFNSSHSMTGTCFPGGEKIFVSSSGKLRICEKISQSAPHIGDVFSGFDFDNIRLIIGEYNQEIQKNKCWDCDQWFLCTLCFASAFKNGSFTFDCEEEKLKRKAILKKLIERKEEKDEKNYNSYHAIDVVSFIDSL